MNECKVTIIVATYNNEKYIKELMSSLLSQTHKNLDIVVSDDGSSDRTLEEVEYFCKIDSRVRILSIKNEVKGAMTNFFTLLLNTDGEYTMCCDADDVWKEDKVEITLKAMRLVEKRFSKEIPILIHTDLVVVDEELNVISDSLFKYEKLSPKRVKLKECLVQNTVTGCTAMINRALKEKIHNTPDNAVMHDWWFALIASAFGRIEVIKERTVLYRQHKGNQVGAYDSSSISANFHRLTDKERTKRIYTSMFRQAKCFANMYEQLLSEEQMTQVIKFAEMEHLSKMQKIIRIVTGRYYKNTLVRNIGQFLVI